MARPDRVQIPASQGGIMRYFDDYRSRIEFKPGHIIVLAIVVVIIEMFLHIQGYALLGLR